MSIHSEIKRLRVGKGWSMEDLAVEVSRREGRTKPLNWQTVQQWEVEGGTSPTRKRLQHVADALETTVTALIQGVPVIAAKGGSRPSTSQVLDLLEDMLIAVPVDRRNAIAEGLAGWAREPDAAHRKDGLLGILQSSRKHASNG